MRYSHLRVSAAVLVGAVFLIGLTGCQGQADDTHRFSGTVTYQGEPVKVGTIMFEPDSSQGNSGAPATVPITDGRYDSRDHRVGFIGGPHKVVVLGFDGVITEPEFAPHGSPIGGGRRLVRSFDFPHDDVELDIEMADWLKK